MSDRFPYSGGNSENWKLKIGKLKTNSVINWTEEHSFWKLWRLRYVKYLMNDYINIIYLKYSRNAIKLKLISMIKNDIKKAML